MTIDIDQLSESELIHLNERIVQRLRMMNQMRAHMRMLDFTLGERVWFQTEGEKIVRGVLVKYNKKSVTVITDEGSRWTVSPSFLRKTEEAAAGHSGGKIVEMRGTASGRI
jgi:biotin-(acetyl-CoA carboxylase) ligase